METMTTSSANSIHWVRRRCRPEVYNSSGKTEDAERYQCIFATEEGAVVAPAAGLHFSRELMKRLQIKDCQFAFYFTFRSWQLSRDRCRGSY